MVENQYAGKLIAIDGPNGAGKSTIINGLKNRLAQDNILSYFTKEPSESDIGEFTRKYAETNSGLSLACLVGADRYFHLETEIIPQLKAGCFVFSDRYILSSLILQGIDGVHPSLICKINENVIKPDLQIVVWASEETLQDRLKGRDVLTRFEKGQRSREELEFMKAGVVILEELGTECIHIYTDRNLDDNIEYIVKCALDLGERNERFHSH